MPFSEAIRRWIGRNLYGVKSVRWQILHEGKEVGFLTDPTGADLGIAGHARYTIVPAHGQAALVVNVELWKQGAFQFRHPDTAEVITDRWPIGDRDEITKRLAESKVILLRLQTDAERDTEIDAALDRLWKRVYGNWFRQQAEEFSEAWHEGQFQARHPVEPVHAGRSFSSWLDDVFLKDETGSHEAVSAILSMGEATVPFLYKLVRFGGGDLPTRILAMEQAKAWEDSFNHDYHPYRYCERFFALFRSLTPLSGPLTTRLAPLLEPPVKLRTLLDKHSPHCNAAEALVCVRGDAIPALVAAIRHPDVEVRCLVLRSLSGFAAPVEPLLPLVIDTLKDAHAKARREGFSLLHTWIQDRKLTFTPAATEWFIQALQDLDASIRYQALRHLEDLSWDFDLTAIAPHIDPLRKDDEYPDIQALAWIAEDFVLRSPLHSSHSK